MIEDPDARIDAGLADRLWELAGARASDPQLALHAAEALPLGAYKVIDYLGAHSASVGDALRRIVAYFPLVDPRARFEIDETVDPIALSMRTTDGEEVPAGGQDYTFAALVTRLRAMVATPLPIDAVELTYPEPPDASEHVRIFGARVRFGQPVARLLLSASAWETPMRATDPALIALLEHHASALVSELEPRRELATRVRDALIEDVRAQRAPRVDRVARRVGMSARTLQRSLRAEGMSFAALLDDARRATACAYLGDPQISLAEIAWLLAFADQSTFARAFKRWTGVTPGAWRAQPRRS